jgi:hypothetical protein
MSDASGRRSETIIEIRSSHVLPLFLKPSIVASLSRERASARCEITVYRTIRDSRPSIAIAIALV